MENLKMITRRRFPNDHRRVRVSISSGSRALAARMAPQIEAVYMEIDAILGKAFRIALYESLDELRTKLTPLGMTVSGR
jgi:DNA-binding MarR family transcriptional regulator